MNHMHLFLAKRILITISYTEQFSFPLSSQELYLRLAVDFSVSKKDFTKSILFLLKNNFITYYDRHFFIFGLDIKKQKELLLTKKNRALFAKKKWQELALFLKFAKFIPFISAIAVTGSLAVNNTLRDDDIDFLIVTKANRLWITRIIIVALASIFGKRRSFAKEEKNSWCFNLWVEETDLKMPSKSRSAYEAYEVAQAVWVLDREKIKIKFKKLNKWAKKFVFNYYHLNKSTQNVAPIHTSNANYLSIFAEAFVISQLLSLINFLLFLLQYMYMKPHMTREKVSKSHAFFHPRDTKGQIDVNWKKSLSRVLKV